MTRRITRKAKSPWTPTVTFATPGNLVVGYAANGRQGYYSVDGNEVYAEFVIVTSSFSYTTSAGTLNVTGMPFTATAETGFQWMGLALQWQGVTFATAGLTTLAPRVTATLSVIDFIACGSGKTAAAINTLDVPTASPLILIGAVRFRI